MGVRTRYSRPSPPVLKCVTYSGPLAWCNSQSPGGFTFENRSKQVCNISSGKTDQPINSSSRRWNPVKHVLFDYFFLKSCQKRFTFFIHQRNSNFFHSCGSKSTTCVTRYDSLRKMIKASPDFTRRDDTLFIFSNEKNT